MRAASLVLLALGLACAELPPIAGGVCGNGVVDPGEACDTFAAAGHRCAAPDHPLACAFVCDAEAVCPVGYGCGADGKCRAGGGGFEEVAGSPWRMEASHLLTGNVDGDAYTDLLGYGPAGISVRFGGAGGQLAQDYEVAAALRGPPGAGDLDEDGRDDLAAPIDLGVVAFLGTEERTLGALPFSPVDASQAMLGARGVPLHTGVAATHSIMIMIDGVMCIAQWCPTATGVVALPGGHTADQLLGRVATGELDAGALFPYDEFVLSFAGDANVYHYDIETFALPGPGMMTGLRPRLRATIAMPGPVQAPVRLVDLNNDDRLDLMALVTSLGEARVAVGHGNWLAGFDPPAVDNSFDGFRGACSTTRWPLAVGHLNARAGGLDEFVDFVGDRAACVAIPLVGYFTVAFPSSALDWSEAVVADFNGDDDLDIAASTEGIDGVDFFLGNGEGLFNAERVDTNYPANRLRVGDYNGDYLNDLAVVERADVAGAGGQDLSVLFGKAAGAPEPPVPMARFDFIEHVEPLDLITTLSTIDAITDLIVISRESEGAGLRAAGLLIGNASRRMTSPYFLPPGQFALLTQTGAFSPPEGGVSDAFRDIVTIVADVDQAVVPLSLGDRHVTLLRGDGGGSFPARDALVFDLPALGFAPACALLAVGDLDRDGRDSLVAVDGVRDAFAPLCSADGERQDEPRLLVLGVDSETALVTEVSDLGAWRAPVALQLVDLDGDDLPELIVTYRGQGGGQGAGVVVYRNVGGELDVAGGTALMGVEDAFGAAALALRPGEPPAIAVLGDRTILLYEQTAGVFGAPGRVVAELTAREGDASSLLAFDADLDGLVDLIVKRGPQVALLRGLEAP